MTEKLKIFAATVEDTARAQIDEMNDCEAYKDCAVRIMPDCHAGKGCTIGTVEGRLGNPTEGRPKGAENGIGFCQSGNWHVPTEKTENI